MTTKRALDTTCQFDYSDKKRNKLSLEDLKLDCQTVPMSSVHEIQTTPIALPAENKGLYILEQATTIAHTSANNEQFKPRSKRASDRQTQCEVIRQSHLPIHLQLLIHEAEADILEAYYCSPPVIIFCSFIEYRLQAHFPRRMFCYRVAQINIDKPIVVCLRSTGSWRCNNANSSISPGGNLDSSQDGLIPDVDDPLRHQDSKVYRLGAIRECFEECGIILAKEANNKETKRLLQVGDYERNTARRQIHENKLKFVDWIASRNGTIDADGLIPFTRWITPTNVSKRFTTQMYLYFLPIVSDQEGNLRSQAKTDLLTPTSDGGIEHTTAQFLPITEALDRARSGRIVLYPPQFFLMYLLSLYINGKPGATSIELQAERDDIVQFIYSGSPPWTNKCISPTQLAKGADGRTILGLDQPGIELRGSGRSGDPKRVILVDFQKNGPRKLEVTQREDILRREGKL